MSSSDPQSFEDAPKKVASAVASRLRGPLFAAFAVAWALFNWRVLLWLAAPTIPAKEKIAEISALTAEPMAFWAPALFALAYTLVAPWLTVLLRLYADIPDSKLVTRERRKREEAIVFDQHLIDLQVRHLNEQRRKLDAEKELSQLKNKLANFFSTAQSEFELSVKAAIAQADGELRKTTQDAFENFDHRMSDIDERARLVVSRTDEVLREKIQRMHRDSQRLLEEAHSIHEAALEATKNGPAGSIELEFGSSSTDSQVKSTRSA